MTAQKTADIHTIQSILPHRYPFLLVDRVEQIDGYASALGIKNVTMNEPHFQGHFPAAPIMPGVTIVEAMAQTAGVMVGVGLDLAGKDMLIYFMAIDKCKFRRKVIPGDVLHMRLTTLRGKPGGEGVEVCGRGNGGRGYGRRGRVHRHGRSAPTDPRRITAGGRGSWQFTLRQPSTPLPLSMTGPVLVRGVRLGRFVGLAHR